ncbi:MAG: type II toxin-antitoxin system HicB family antitoxin [Prevotella sp.]
MDCLEYKGYTGTVEFSKEDNCLFGKVKGMGKDLIVYEGRTIDELREDFQQGIDDYISGCYAEGITPRKPYSGRLSLRLPQDLHSRIAAYAESIGVTVNDFINRAVTNELRNNISAQPL